MMSCDPIVFGATILAASWRMGVAQTTFSELPWSELEQRVGDQLVDTGPQDYLDQCYPEFQELKWVPGVRSGYNLIDQPSGLCMPNLFCGFERCVPDAEYLGGTTPNGEVFPGPLFRFYSPEDLDGHFAALGLNASFASDFEGYMDPANPAFDVPSKVLFPRNAGDAVAAVAFARAHGLELSVKNSGHSYSGKSMKANTLLLNMNQYKRYAFDDEETNGVVECGATADDAVVNEDLSNQACLLAAARGKPAFVRVGGGENFDKLYRSVRRFNERQDEFKYHLVGGAVGTVSPMGWTFEGGLSGTSGGRKFGFGVDQVLQIEAVLPSGEHVRFGPTGWEDSEGYSYPKTTEVSGACNQNPEGDEADWVWGPCSGETDALFDDLWFAFRGGGGGTWGIVLSVYLQLHDYAPYTLVEQSPECPGDHALQTLLIKFELLYFLDPVSLGVEEEQSYACGCATDGARVSFHCFSNDAAIGDDLISLWQEFLSENAGLLTEEVAAGAPGCLVQQEFKDYIGKGAMTEGPHAGKAYDDPLEYAGTTNALNLLVPKSWVLENIDFLATNTGNPVGNYYAFGGDAFAHDQTTSLSPAHREAGIMMFVFNSIPETLPLFPENFWTANQTVWNPLLKDMYDFTTGVVPPHLNANHLGPTTRGPLREDPTKPCPVLDLTITEAESKCHSAQEAIWGTEILKRLEAIKKAVDPNGMFDCFNCVGNNVKSMTPGADSSSEADIDSGMDDAGDKAEEGGPVNTDEMSDGKNDKTGEDSKSAAASKFKLPIDAITVVAAIMFVLLG